MLYSFWCVVFVLFIFSTVCFCCVLLDLCVYLFACYCFVIDVGLFCVVFVYVGWVFFKGGSSFCVLNVVVCLCVCVLFALAL